MTKTVIEETREVCTLCGGRGVESSVEISTMWSMCRRCNGSGQILIKTVTRRELFDLDDIDVLTCAVSDRLMQGVRAGKIDVTHFGPERFVRREGSD
jgi:hypothetical protein